MIVGAGGSDLHLGQPAGLTTGAPGRLEGDSIETSKRIGTTRRRVGAQFWLASAGLLLDWCGWSVEDGAEKCHISRAHG